MPKSLFLRVLEFVRDYPGARAKEVAELLGISPRLAQSILYQLKNKGFVEKAGRGYIVTDKGRWFLSKQSTLPVPGGAREKPVAEQVEERGRATGSFTGGAAASEAIPETRGGEVLGGAERLARPQPSPAPAGPVGRGEEEVAGARGEAVRVDDLEKRVEELLDKVARLEEELRGIKSELIRIHKLVSDKKPGARAKEAALPVPVMPYSAALRELGSALDTLIVQGRVVVVGSLVVEKGFYDSFIAKLPLPRSKVRELSPYEKQLLEEMRKEGQVYLRGGKEYRLA